MVSVKIKVSLKFFFLLEPKFGDNAQPRFNPFQRSCRRNIYRNRYTHVITSTKLRLKTNVVTDEGNSRNEM